MKMVSVKNTSVRTIMNLVNRFSEFKPKNGSDSIIRYTSRRVVDQYG